VWHPADGLTGWLAWHLFIVNHRGPRRDPAPDRRQRGDSRAGGREWPRCPRSCPLAKSPARPRRPAAQVAEVAIAIPVRLSPFAPADIR
jgi:hypothetical protein